MFMLARQRFNMRHDVLISVAGLSLLLPVPLMLFSKNMPSELYPLPVIVAMPALLGLRYMALAIPMLLFFVWNPRLFRGEAEVPKRSQILLATATLLSIPWFVVGWKYGLEFQGGRYTYSVLAINIASLSVLWATFARRHKVAPSFQASLLFQWLLFAWLGWYAFPYLGELP